jgi:hypothetical protein
VGRSTETSQRRDRPHRGDVRSPCSVFEKKPSLDCLGQLLFPPLCRRRPRPRSMKASGVSLAVSLTLLLQVAAAAAPVGRKLGADRGSGNDHVNVWNGGNTTQIDGRVRVCYPLPPDHEKVTRQGQITQGTSFGVALNALASRTEVKRVLEIGTW